MSDTAIKAIAFVCWPLIVCIFAGAMALALLVMVLAWPFVPFMKIKWKDAQ